MWLRAIMSFTFFFLLLLSVLTGDVISSGPLEAPPTEKDATKFYVCRCLHMMIDGSAKKQEKVQEMMDESVISTHG